MPLLGRLKKRIGEVCGGISRLEKECATKKLENGDEKKPGMCLELTQLYAQLSIMRQLILVDVASLLSDVSESDDSNDLTGVANNVLNMVKKEQIADKDVLQFLVDPMNNPDKRLIIAELINSPQKYETLNDYLHTLNSKVEGTVFKKQVVACSGPNLRCDCRAFEVGYYDDLKMSSNKDNWNEKIQSLFIPFKMKVNAYTETRSGGKTLGPYYGPIVHGKIFESGKWSSLDVKIADGDGEDGTKMVRICEAEYMKSTGYCDLIPLPEFRTKTIQMNNFHGSSWSSIVVNSIYVPKGYRVMGVAQNAKHISGWSYGPITVNKRCNGSQYGQYKKLFVEKTTKDTSRMVTFCDEENLNGRCYKDDKSRNHLITVRFVFIRLILLFGYALSLFHVSLRYKCLHVISKFSENVNLHTKRGVKIILRDQMN